ncbi:histidine phosphotransferase family protein [Sphingobium nicotianae]|uniref:Histidine phosphotransferase n=1 Tax=Sphingobium nicotianae TaxID=2782607 RepID=A0A9X1DFG1_9SPHN|nr:histidine phosphotransferase family protein [Sphingobium nicotianae]MBT2188899.1 histidine phosphotransferase [Sphingobium nicotianae]
MAQSPDPIDFASLLCSRLCHDLLSPVGALNNGLELLAVETDPQMREQCFGLLGDSARTTAGKLKFFRLAFGAAGGYGEAIPVHEIRNAVEGMFPAGGKLSLEWMIDSDALSKPAAKLLLNLVLMTGEALPRGGVIAIGAEERGGVTEIAVRGEGAKLIFDPAIRAAVEGSSGEVTTRTAAAFMIRTIAEQCGGQILISAPEDPFLMFGASLPAR